MSTPDPMQPGTFTSEELARRRANSRRLAWVLAAIVLAIYAFGLFVKR